MIALFLLLGVAGIAVGGWFATAYPAFWWVPVTLALLAFGGAYAWRRKVIDPPEVEYQILDEEVSDDVSAIEQEMLRANASYRVVLPKPRLNGRDPWSQQ